MKKVLVVVDMQNDFIAGSLGSKDAEATVDPIIREIRSGSYDYVALTRDTHQDNYLKTLEGINLPVEHCLYGTSGWQINDKIYAAVLETGIEYKIFDKKSFGCLSLASELDVYHDVLEEITVCGLCTDICVAATALHLRSCLPDVPMYYVEDATAGLSVENKKAALIVLNSCQIYERKK